MEMIEKKKDNEREGIEKERIKMRKKLKKGNRRQRTNREKEERGK